MVSPVEGLSVAEPVFLQATLVATCQYQQGQIPVDGATILLKVTDLEPAFTRGIAVNGTTCPAAVVTTSQGVAQFDFEPGIRSIFTNLDSEGAPEFSLLEILAAETRIVGWSEDRFEWETIDSSTGKDLAIEPGEPFTIDWIHDPDLVIPTDTLSYLEYNLGQNATFQNGPEFVLLDEFNNVVVQWGKDDPQWHRDPQGEIFIQNPGTEGTPPWAGISFEPLSDPLFYNPIQFSSVLFTGTTAPGSYYGSTSWDVCVNTTENGTICSTWGVDNSGALNWIYTLWPFISNETASPFGEEYVSTDDWFNLASATTQPGKPLRFAIRKRKSARYMELVIKRKSARYMELRKSARYMELVI